MKLCVSLLKQPNNKLRGRARFQLVPENHRRGVGPRQHKQAMMRLPKFEYHVPQTIAEAVKIIGDAGPEGQFVAGGTDLYPNMKRRQQMPPMVISVMRLAELNQITGDGAQGLRIG